MTFHAINGEFYSHGDLPLDRVSKSSNQKRFLICDECLDRAKGDSTTRFESKTHKLLQNFLHSLDSDEVDTTSNRNSELVSLIMHRLATLQSSVIDSEIQAEIRSPKTHETLKGNCCEFC